MNDTLSSPQEKQVLPVLNVITSLSVNDTPKGAC